MSRSSHLADHFRPARRLAWACATVALLAAALFFFLHAVIPTGQEAPGQGPKRSERIDLSVSVDEMIESVEDMRPAASSVFDVYLDEGRLVYVKEECIDEDIDALFFLHLHPADVAGLPHLQLHGFANLDFAFKTYGLRDGGRCAVERLLPDYELAAIHTGQYVGEDREWSERIDLSGAVDKMIEGVEDMRPAASSAFDVYLDEGRLVYVKEECGTEDIDALFFLHLHPTDIADLPHDRQAHGFANLDFSFETHGLRGGGRCAAERLLPGYELAAIQTGQYVPGEDREWSERIDLSGAVDKVIEGVEDMRPAASSVFDVYLDEDRLVYVKEECSPEDVDAPFFLHLRPADVADLPPDRQPHGFANLDFSFETNGLRSGRRCAAERLLPGYELAAIQTGQYVPGEDREWSARIGPNSLQ